MGVYGNGVVISLTNYKLLNVLFVEVGELKIGIIGYGSMGKMILEKISQATNLSGIELFVSNRTGEKIVHLADICNVCVSNTKLASLADIIFICVRPIDLKEVLTEIKDYLREDTFLVSLNVSIQFEQMEMVCKNKIAKVIPSITAEINQSQTLVCYNKLVSDEDKVCLTKLLQCMGNVIELPEHEIGMGSELVSCMPGFIAAIFNEICVSAKKHTNISENEIIEMVLNTMVGTGGLMLANDYSFGQVISRVATKGGIAEVGTEVIHEQLPKVADELFNKTLEKRKQTTMNAQKMFAE